MNQHLAAIPLMLCAGTLAGAGQELPAKIAALGIKELAFEVPETIPVGGASTKSYGLGSGGGADAYTIYSRGAVMHQVVGGDIYVIDAQHTSPRKIVSGGSHPAWSPDGSELAYCTWNGLLIGQIEVVNVDGTGRRQLTDMKGGACFPDWSPDGTKIVFTALSPGASEKNLMGAIHTEILAVDKNGGDPVPVTEGYSARWSPGGSLVILLRRSEKKGDKDSVWLATPDGRQTKMIGASDQVIRGAEWLPSGRGIVASYMHDGRYSIFRSYLDGSQPQGAPPKEVGVGNFTDWFDPAISPDEKHLLAIVVGCARDKQGNTSQQAGCFGGRIAGLDLDTNKEVTLASGVNYSVIWERK